MDVGLFFGSFNPIHTGHLIIAHTIRELAELKEVWFVVSPQNPHKRSASLLPEQDRLDLVRAAIHDDYNFRVSDIEFSMPKPSFTADTLTYLRERFPSKSFHLIMGGDNLKTFHKWKNHRDILVNHNIIVYPRNGERDYKIPERLREYEGKIKIAETPFLEISATYIRDLLRRGKSVKYLVPKPVEELLKARQYFT